MADKALRKVSVQTGHARGMRATGWDRMRARKTKRKREREKKSLKSSRRKRGDEARFAIAIGLFPPGRMENTECAISRDIKTTVVVSFRALVAFRRLSRARRGCPRIRRRCSGPTTTCKRCRVDATKEKERDGENEQPYETFSITKSNTANVARRRKNGEGVKEPRGKQLGCSPASRKPP